MVNEEHKRQDKYLVLLEQKNSGWLVASKVATSFTSLQIYVIHLVKKTICFFHYAIESPRSNWPKEKGHR